jgi:hypothetical protein
LLDLRHQLERCVARGRLADVTPMWHRQLSLIRYAAGCLDVVFVATRSAVLVAAVLVAPTLCAAERPPASVPAAEKLHIVVSDLKTRLEMSAPVIVSIVPKNALMMSTEAPADHRRPFRLVIDAKFVVDLTEEELEAAIAHELGHVWLFTHHPYLQTEELANQIAMRAVTRAALERVYEKLWKHVGARGDPARVLGPEPTAAALATVSEH